MTPAAECLDRLREGNRRYVAGRRAVADDAGRRAEITAGQRPFAVVLGCSDSRVPPEVVFDQGLGDLFVVRVAGNVVAPMQVESIEYAVRHLGARLVVVLGHSGCGAVQAAVEASRLPAGEKPAEMTTTIERILPSVAEARAAGAAGGADVARQAVRRNVAASIDALRDASTVLADTEGLVIAGAEYDLETGRVEFLD